METRMYLKALLSARPSDKPNFSHLNFHQLYSTPAYQISTGKDTLAINNVPIWLV